MAMTDGQMRRKVIQHMDFGMRSAQGRAMVAESNGDAADSAEALRLAAHYQQAIDLLTAAPMPPKDEPR